MKPVFPHSGDGAGSLSDVDPSALPPGDSPPQGGEGDVHRFVTLLFSTGFVSIAALLFNIVLMRVLTVADFGHIGVIRTVLELMLVPAMFGMNTCIARHVADDRASEGDRSRMLRTGAALMAATSIVTLAATYLLLAWPAVLPDPVAIRSLRGMILMVPFVAFYGMALGYLQGTGRVRRMAAVQGGRSFVRLGLGSALVWVWGFPGWIAAYVAVEFLAFLAAGASIFRRLRGSIDRQYLRPFVSFSGYATLTMALTTLLYGVDVLCLVHFHADPEMIAHYKAATYIFTTALLLPNTFIQARWATMVGRAYNPDHLWGTLGRNTVFLMGLVLPAAAVAYFLAPLLPLVFGEGYQPSVQIFQWLIPAFIIHSAGKLSSNLVIGAGLMRAQLLTSVATLVLNVILNISLIPSMGIAGAVIATTGSIALKTLLSPIVLSRYRASAA